MESTEKNPEPSHTHAALWRQVWLRLLPGTLAAAAGFVVASRRGPIRNGGIDQMLLSLLGVVLFAGFSVVVLLGATQILRHVLADSRLKVGQASFIRFLVRIVGYGMIFLGILSLLGVPVGSLVVGGAALGIILGVAAQQALSNIFASFVLVIARPFEAGDYVTINAGAFGREYSGQIEEVGLTHTRLKEKEDVVVLLPNSALLQWATITPYENKPNEPNKPKRSGSKKGGKQ